MVPTFGISKIDRKKLYGFKKRLFLDEKGKECSKANLEEETGIVFVSSDISSSYLDHKGNFVEKKELEAINDEGKKVKKEKIAARSNWKSITAVKNDLIFEIKSPLILQPGPAALGPGLDQICCILDDARDRLRG